MSTIRDDEEPFRIEGCPTNFIFVDGRVFALKVLAGDMHSVTKELLSLFADVQELNGSGVDRASELCGLLFKKLSDFETMLNLN
mgnify:CR=1 FL=1